MAVTVAERMAELIRRRQPFVHATVVRAQVPTSAKPGDQAIVLPDGTIEGFVGGQCASGAVRTAALDALADGDCILLRVLPDHHDQFPSSPGARVVVNPCLSGGAVEIFLAPSLPAPNLHLVGTNPTAEAIRQLAVLLGFEVEAGYQVSGDTLALIVATHGGDEPTMISTALSAGVPFVGLVASRKRGEAVLAETGLPADQLARVHTPVGLDIGARTPIEIALSVLAQLVQAIRRDGLALPTAAVGPHSTTPRQAVDPVCGMSVVITPETPHLRLDGVDWWFCNPGCRESYAAAERSG